MIVEYRDVEGTFSKSTNHDVANGSYGRYTPIA